MADVGRPQAAAGVTGKTLTLTETSPDGDQLIVAISPTGRVRLSLEGPRAGNPTAVAIRGLTRQQAVTMKKGFWGKLWDGLKDAANAAVEAITFGVGSASCRPDVKVGMNNGKPESVVIGVACKNF